jgi:hypothetical protein
MKLPLIILWMICCLSCARQDFDWLIGDWKRTDDQEGRATFEYWTKNAGTEYIGLGFTLHGPDTVFMEHLRLYKMAGEWIYEVTGVNEHPTLFPLEYHSELRFRCGNPDNEFPKHIEYSLQDHLLYAKISGGGNDILFTFEKTGP